MARCRRCSTRVRVPNSGLHRVVDMESSRKRQPIPSPPPSLRIKPSAKGDGRTESDPAQANSRIPAQLDGAISPFSKRNSATMNRNSVDTREMTPPNANAGEMERIYNGFDATDASSPSWWASEENRFVPYWIGLIGIVFLASVILQGSILAPLRNVLTRIAIFAGIASICFVITRIDQRYPLFKKILLVTLFVAALAGVVWICLSFA